MAKTKKATGLTINRSANIVTFNWKIGDANYSNGNVINKRYWFNKYGDSPQRWKSEATIWLDTSATSHEQRLYPTGYYPYTGTYLTHACFRIAGCREDYDWSGWSDWYIWEILTPSPPNMGVSWDSNYYNRATFSWESPDPDTSQRWFSDYERQSVLIKDCNTTDGSKVSWAGASTWTGSDTSQLITETTAFSDYYSYTRWYRVRCRGPRGASDWRYEKHVYAQPPYPSDVIANVGYANPSSGYRINVKWQVSETPAHPIDYTYVEYGTVIPTSTVTTITDNGISTRHVELTPPSIDSGTQISVTKDTSGENGIVFSATSVSSVDHVCAVRVVTKHDNQISPSIASYAEGSFAKLTAPSGLTLDQFNPVTKMIRVNVNNNSDVPNNHLALYYKSDADLSESICVGIITGDTDLPLTIRLPDSCATSNFTIGVRARLGDYSPISPLSDTYTTYVLTNSIMESDIVWGEGEVPLPPSKITLTTPKAETIRVTWDWSWNDAAGAELSWSDSEDSWESTNEPSTYVVYNTNQSSWNITGLGVGTWYVRVRLFKSDNGVNTYSGYSDVHSIKLSSAPLTPSLTLSDSVITKDGEVSCYWAYTTTDGTAQMYAEVCTATISDGIVTYGDIIARATSAQHVTISASEQGWESGETIYLCVRVTAASGETSEGWSTPVSLSIAERVGIVIKNTTLEVVSEPESTPYNILTKMPLAVTIGLANPYILTEDTSVDPLKKYYERSGSEGSYIYTEVTDPAGNPHDLGYYEEKKLDGDTIMVIERAEPYYLTRPDESKFDGFEGETIATIKQRGDGTAIFDNSSLIGVLDDGCRYRIIATSTDSYGQVASTDPIEFTVRWDHKAIYPEAEIEVIEEELNTTIIPIAPISYELTSDVEVISEKTYYTRNGTGTTEDPYVYTTVDNPTGDPHALGYYQDYDYSNDYCEVYRISADKPELILDKAEFGTKYVDPYPTLGMFGGYRVVYKTLNNDYIADGNHLAWTDYTDKSCQLYMFATIIDFGEDRVILPFNLSLSNKWNKDFTETKYLGGSIHGDWNAGVSRTGSIKTTVPIEQYPETIEGLRRLAEYAGVCHVRTPEGSNFSANVTVTEDREEKWVNRISKVSIEVTRINPEDLDGMLYSVLTGE